MYANKDLLKVTVQSHKNADVKSFESGLVSEHLANLTSRLHNSANFQQILINEMSKSKLNFFHPTRYNSLIYLTSETSYFFVNLFTFFLGHPVLTSYQLQLICL